MIQPINIPREQFPKSDVKSDGMITLNISCDNRSMEYIPDIEYVNRDGISLYIQLLLPCDRTNSTPLVIYVPGSAFHWQNVKSVIPSISLLVNRGVAVAMVQYGHTVLMAGLTVGIERFEEEIYSEVSSSVKGIIDLYGPTDITKMNDELSSQNHIEPDSPEGCLIGRLNVLEHPDLTGATVVMNYIDSTREIPPILMFHGTNDELVPFGQSCMLYDKLVQCNKTAAFYAIDNAHHGGREFWSNQVFDIIEDFINIDCKALIETSE